jgi:GxxExxY protein
MHTTEPRLNEITHQIIGAAFAVANELGVGYLEKAYENALASELQTRRMSVRQQVPDIVRYKGVIVGNYMADLLVEDQVLVEPKHADGLNEVHTAQCINYLKATGLKVCLLINFGKKIIEYKRVVLGL